ncbi:hypothetical protein CRD60_05960 [Bifidobacterium aemilianum]|uniref:Uncharacterized protein n=2 Tax=Bifidobacterium aemilianum TaxID=2493120 RepID=A0A366K778_9BIFI|nr:hypothetical protein CRD60_05960 [Bifidobacterium aemilianum]
MFNLGGFYHQVGDVLVEHEMPTGELSDGIHTLRRIWGDIPNIQHALSNGQAVQLIGHDVARTMDDILILDGSNRKLL